MYGASTISVNIETAKMTINMKCLWKLVGKRSWIFLNGLKGSKSWCWRSYCNRYFSEGKNKGYNINLFKKLENLDCQLVAHGGAGQRKHTEIFQECNVDCISSLFVSLFYIKQYKYKELKGSNSFVIFREKKKRYVYTRIKKIFKVIRSENKIVKKKPLIGIIDTETSNIKVCLCMNTLDVEIVCITSKDDAQKLTQL